MAAKRPVVTRYFDRVGRRYEVHKISHSTTLNGALRAAMIKVIREGYARAIIETDKNELADIIQNSTQVITVKYFI